MTGLIFHHSFHDFCIAQFDEEANKDTPGDNLRSL